jgi:beta-lactamase regulating signal transducer with metallopeptidase domain
MEQATHILTLFSAAAAGSLVGAIWEGSVLAATVALCLHFVKGLSAAVRSLLWTGVLLLVVLLHFVPLLGTDLVATATPGRALHVDLIWSLAIAGVWAVFSMARAAQLTNSALGLRRIARRATPVGAAPELAALLRTGYRSAELCTSTDVDRPSVIGFFKPRVLIPRDLFEKLCASDLEQIVLHEMEHLRRGDDWINLLQKISLVLFPLNPVLFWVERRLCTERELACDDRVLQVTRAKKAYATCLVNLAEESALHRRASLVLGAWERQSELGRRVRRILRQPEGMMGRRQMTTVASVLALGIVGGALALAREPQLVSFAPLPLSETAASIVPPNGYVPAAYREGMSSGHVVQTVFREPAKPVVPAKIQQTPKVLHRAKVTKVSANGNFRHLDERRRPAPSSSWVMLTGWTSSPQPPRVQLIVSPQTQSTFAAIQMVNGWLIVQL